MVSRKDQRVYEQVLERDRAMYWAKEVIDWPHTGYPIKLAAWMATDPWICVAQLLGASDHCSGDMTRDHVHEHEGGTKGKRALTTMETVVILCRHHHLDGWATAHRTQIREYIKEANRRYEEWKQLKPLRS